MDENKKFNTEYNDNGNNEIKSSCRLQGNMVCPTPKEDNRENEVKTNAFQGSFVDTSNSGLLGVLKKLFGE